MKESGYLNLKLKESLVGRTVTMVTFCVMKMITYIIFTVTGCFIFLNQDFSIM